VGRIDFGANKVHVEVSDWNGHVGPPKGGKPRSVPMTPRLRAALRDLEELRDMDACGRVLTRSKGRYGAGGRAGHVQLVAREWLRPRTCGRA
jgi:integrase